ncbi:MAG: hypothetical protein WCG09_03250 [Halobacteriota archaeon]
MKVAELEVLATNSVNIWSDLALNGKAKQARYRAQLIINKCRSILKGKSTDHRLRNEALILSVLFRGLQNYNELALKLTSSPNWNSDHALIEEIWDLLCDCKERLGFASNYVSRPLIEKVLSELARLELDFQRLFPLPPYFYKGHKELYVSPARDVEKPICSICNRDFRSCEHIQNWIYHGIICYVVPVKNEQREQSLVTSAREKRSRIWPWNIKAGGKKVEISVASNFRLDDFISEDTKGGSYGKTKELIEMSAH